MQWYIYIFFHLVTWKPLIIGYSDFLWNKIKVQYGNKFKLNDENEANLKVEWPRENLTLEKWDRGNNLGIELLVGLQIQELVVPCF